MAGVDFSLRRRQITVAGMVAGAADRAPLSITETPRDDGGVDIDTSAFLDGRDRHGVAYGLQVSANSRRMSGNVAVSGASPDFRNQLGRFQRVGIRRTSGFGVLSQYPSGGFLLRVDERLTVTRTDRYGGGLLDYAVGPGLRFEFPRRTSVDVGSFVERVTLFNATTNTRIPLNVANVQFGISTTPTRLFNVSLFGFAGTREIIDPADPRVGTGLNATLTVGVRPTDRLGFELRGQRSNHYERGWTSLVDDAEIYRLIGTYQFTRGLGVRLIGELSDQFNALAPDPLGKRNVRYGSSVLLTYEIAPGSLLYAGYNDVQRDFDPRLVDGSTRVRTENQVFLKLSYLFRP